MAKENKNAECDKLTVNGVVRKGGVGENEPTSEVNQNIGKPGQTIVTDKSEK
jgi:hypothetical protein